MNWRQPYGVSAQDGSTKQGIPKKRIGYCRQAARSLIKQYRKGKGVFSLPIPAREIAVWKGFYVELLESLPDAHSALVLHDKKLIGLNSRHHIHRQRFSLGHELGHICLGHPPESELSVAERKKCDNEADEFAAELLMPLELLKAEVRPGRNIEELARLFKVSPEAMYRKILSHNMLSKL